MVYRDAELPNADGHSDNPECGQHRGESRSCLRIGNEGGRRSPRHPRGSVCRIPYGSGDVGSGVWQTVEAFPVRSPLCMAFDERFSWSKPRHFPAHALSHQRDALFYFRRVVAG